MNVPKEAKKKNLLIENTPEDIEKYFKYTRMYNLPKGNTLLIANNSWRNTLHDCITIVQNVNKLDISDIKLKQDTRLGYLPNLIELDLFGNPIDHLKEVESLSKLRLLRLNDTKITTLKFAPKIPSLAQLEVLGCLLLDFSPLKHCRDLTVNSGVPINRTSKDFGVVVIHFVNSSRHFYCKQFITYF